MDNERIQRLHKFMHDFKMFLRNNYYDIENKDIQWYLCGLVQNVNELKERIMDCEKFYKDALERAKKLKETCDSTAVVGWCEYIFPELKESEDDKIRDELLNHLKEASYGNTLVVSTLDYKRWADWLEKQGESKFEQCVQEGDKIVTNEDGTHFNTSQLERVAKKESKWDTEKKELKKIEDKPLVIDEGKAEMDYCFTKMMNGEMVSSAWSEEDERNLQGVIDEIEANKNQAPDYDLVTYDRFLSWLKSLKERMKGE